MKDQQLQLVRKIPSLPQEVLCNLFPWLNIVRDRVIKPRLKATPGIQVVRFAKTASCAPMARALFVVSLICATSALRATHFLGGDIGHQCLGGGLYAITLQLYRDCAKAGTGVEIVHSPHRSSGYLKQK